MKKGLFLLTAIMMVKSVFAADVKLLANDKEPLIGVFDVKEKERILSLYANKPANLKVRDIFYQAVQSYMQSENLKCEFRLMNFFEYGLYKANYTYTQEDIQNHLKMLRASNFIDDILYDLVSGINTDYFALRALTDSTKAEKGISQVRKKLLDVNDLNEELSPFKTWPDENKNQCVYQEYVHLKNIVFDETNKLSKDDNDLRYVIGHGYYQNIIPVESFKKLEYLRTKSNINKRELWLQDYMKVIFNAKNKMVPVAKLYLSVNFDRKIEKSETLPSEILKRKERLTKRKLLYLKYDETQIIQLATILQNASRRMGTDPDVKSSRPMIVQEFQVQLRNGQRQTYVEKNELDPQSQYNYARRMLRKDIVQLQMMDSFRNLKVTYDDVVVAALETGYINFEDIQFVVTYDDLWNPNKTRFQKTMGFIFDVAGYSTFFVPAPWNIAAAIVLGVAEGIVDSKSASGADHDNPATIIE